MLYLRESARDRRRACGAGRRCRGKWRVFEGAEAAHAPLGVGHVLDEAEMDTVLGAEALHVVFEDDVEVFLGFECVDGVRGKQALAEGVEGRTAFSFFGDGAAGEGSVLA